MSGRLVTTAMRSSLASRPVRWAASPLRGPTHIPRSWGFPVPGPGVLQRDPGQIDARGDVELAEHLAQVERDGVRADEQLVGYLPIGQALGHQAGRGLLDVGEAGPASRGPCLTRPVPASHPELAQPPAGTRHASPRPEPAVLHERL